MASTGVVDGNAREAHATVSADLDIAGLIKLTGMTWDAFHRTGKDPKATASFDLGTGSILGAPIPRDSETQAETAINSALAYTGHQHHLPEGGALHDPGRPHPDDADADRPAGLAGRQGRPRARPQPHPGPAEQLFTQLASTVCDLAAALLVGDIGLDVASGTGFLVVEIGGAEATTGNLVLDSPFGKIGPAPTSGAFPQLIPPAIVPPGLATFPGPLGPISSPAQRTSSIGPLVDHCQSANTLAAHGLLDRRPAARGADRPGRHRRRGRPRLAPPAPAASPLGGAGGGSRLVSAASPSQANRRLLRSYAPLVAVAVAFTVMALSVSTVPRQHLAYAGSVNVPDVAGTGGTGGGTTTGGRRRHGRDGRRRDDRRDRRGHHGRRRRRPRRRRGRLQGPGPAGARRPVLPALLRVQRQQRRRHQQGCHRQRDPRVGPPARGAIRGRDLRLDLRPERERLARSRSPTRSRRWPTTSPATSSSTGASCRSTSSRGRATAPTSSWAAARRTPSPTP